MPSQRENVLYTTVSEGLALIRYGAVNLLRNSKDWSLDGWLIDAGAAGSLCPAYSLQELLSVKTERQIEVEVTGNSRYDLSMAMSKILSEMRRKRPMPFRVWTYDRYSSSSRRTTIQFLVDPSGQLRSFKFNGRTYEEIDPSSGIEVERSTGYDDRHGVPIFQNDAVILGGNMFRVTWCNGWQLSPFDGDESACLDMVEVRKDVTVVNSSRNDRNMLSKVASLMESQERFSIPAWK